MEATTPSFDIDLLAVFHSISVAVLMWKADLSVPPWLF